MIMRIENVTLCFRANLFDVKNGLIPEPMD